MRAGTILARQSHQWGTVMAFEKIKLERDGGVAVLTLNDPDTLNAVSITMITELGRAVDKIAASDARCLVMTGAGRGFCSGANLADRSASMDMTSERDLGAVLEAHYHPFLLKLRALKMPFITAVNGPAAGVGMSFALMGDMVLVAKGTYFLQAFRRIGLVPDGGATWLLPRLVGRARAMELSLMGDKLPAEKAHEWGLINRLCEPDALMDETMALARELAAGPTVALALIRKAYWDTFENSYEDQLHTERTLQREAGRTEDFLEGVSAFLEKRKAAFKGK
jgi:2-(1,2-epoxy-1,2-dihydrophenyl)acetyl-CoA isomerase